MKGMPTITIKVDAREVDSAISASPAQIARVNRLVINKLMREAAVIVTKKVATDTGVMLRGFRKVRTHKTPVKARRKVQRATIWLGGNSIRAHYLRGKARDVTGGAKINKTFFKDAFAATMPNGYRSIWKREGERLVEQSVPVPTLRARSIEAIREVEPKVHSMLRVELQKVLFK